MTHGLLDKDLSAPAAVRRLPGSLRLLAGCAAFLAGYLLLDWISYIHPMQTFHITPWNPHPAVAIALLMIAGQRSLPLVFAAVFAAEVLVRGAPAWGLFTVLGSIVLSLGYAAIAQALTGAFRIERQLAVRRDVLRLAGVVGTGVFLTGVLYIAAMYASGIGTLDDYPVALIKYWIGDSVGVLVTLPLVLMVADPGRRQQIRNMFARKETLFQAGVIGLITWLVLGQDESKQFEFFYLFFLPLIWVAARYGMVGAALAAVVIQTGIIVAVQLVGHQSLTVFELQSLLLALALTGFFLGVTVDEREHMSAELHHSLRLAAAGEMAAALAHELNQPLTALSNYARASQLLVESPDSDRQRLVDTLQKLMSEAKRAGEVVRRLRDFFRTGATRLESVRITVLIDSVVGALRAKASEGNIALRCVVKGSIPELLADPVELEVVLRNLINNATEAIRGAGAQSGTVTVEVSRAGRAEIMVSVMDTGPGIGAEEAAGLFTPFETSKASGMGMGLAISRAIVETHGGRLWAEPGARGVMRLTLPVTGSGHG